MKDLPKTKQGYPVKSYSWIEWQSLKDKPQSGIILAKRKDNVRR